MKTQLLKLLTVCLITSVLFLPALIVVRIWQYHREFLAMQHGVASVQPLSTPMLTILSFLLSILLGFYSGLVINEWYRTHRDTTLKKQVATLERLWQQSIY